LDHIVYTVSVGARDACGVGPQALVTAGFSTLLEALPNPDSPPSRADAAIHVFELPGNYAMTRARAMVLFVDATPLERGQAPTVYSWVLETSISDYVSNHNGLFFQIRAARKTQDYSKVANELKERLFSAATGVGAANAFIALQRIAREAKREPLILARITSLNGKLAFLPLSLLAGGEKPLLARPLTVVHPSPDPASPLTPSCVKPWTFGVPTNLAPKKVEIIDEPDRSWISKHRRGTHSDLNAYLSPPDPLPATGSPVAEGLLLLAHQDDGYLWYDDETDRIPFTRLKRRFPPGSVAILSACSTANPKGDNMAWLEKMSENGIDTIFASPFPVPLPYGVELTRRFIGAMHEAQDSQESPTVASLVLQASNDAAQHAVGVSKDIRHEFVLIGDHDVRLCK
jgi:hypothetical protein